MNILVTGAAGFIGSHLAERLANQKHNVIGIDSLLNNYDYKIKEKNIQQLKNKNVYMIISDINEANLSDLIEDTDFIFHLAAQPGIDSRISFRQYEQNNTIATLKLLDAARQNNRLKGFINISTSSVYGANATNSEIAELKPISYYGVTKLASEQLVMSESRNGNLKSCSLRLYSVYGPRERPEKLYHKLIKSILLNKEFPIYEGSELHIRSYTYIDDIIDGIINAFNSFDICNGEIFNIGNEKSITTGEGIRIVEEILGKSAKLVTLPKRFGDQSVTTANIEKAKKILNYQPIVSPQEGLIHQVEWCKKVYGF